MPDKIDIIVVLPRAGRSVFYEEAETSRIRAIQYTVGRGFKLGTKNITGANVAKNRKRGAESALELNSRWTMFIDDDMVLPEDTLIRLMEADKDIVSGFCVSRRPPFLTAAYMHDKRTFYRNLTEWPDDTLMEVDAVGAACLLVRTEVFRNIKKPWFHFYDNWESSMGEDLFFCRRAQRKGYKIWLDTGLIIGHIGDCAFTIYDYLSFRAQQREFNDNNKRTGQESIIVAAR